jgi:hypothetical protein
MTRKPAHFSNELLLLKRTGLALGDRGWSPSLLLLVLLVLGEFALQLGEFSVDFFVRKFWTVGGELERQGDHAGRL